MQRKGFAGSLFPAIPPLPGSQLQEPSPAQGAHLTWLRTQVGVKAFRLEHDEQRAPAQEDCREEEVFQYGRAGHPPAAPMGSGQGGRHGAARCGCLAPAPAPALQPPAHRPRRQRRPCPTRAATPSLCRRARSLSLLRGPEDRFAQRGKQAPALTETWITPSPQLPDTAAFCYAGAVLARDFSRSSLQGKLRHRRKGRTHFQGRGTSPCSQ